ncbi:3beta-hydroxysteroid-dehydrogenase/decarboxylase isoform 2 [Glycine soja]|uniref:3beta-hydroxysteroid-dehydrogenase/decarboxylase isoform 2 n=1 Tax=Glycine soja TaxID=3848 RepID=A0A445KYY7_GLYSO|nr:3beta-hydroxysteroid-dehydrogenase/decarboxylase isoform 2 [Glycine soja]
MFVLLGTHNVIDACMELNVKRLVYTSCIIYPSFPSIFFDDVHGIHNGNETMPYVHSVHTLATYLRIPNDHYSATKAKGEALVIKANGTNGLLTCCIRPSSIFEPGDRLSMPSLVAAARKET